jgi:hypothetical protein
MASQEIKKKAKTNSLHKRRLCLTGATIGMVQPSLSLHIYVFILFYSVFYLFLIDLRHWPQFAFNGERLTSVVKAVV